MKRSDITNMPKSFDRYINQVPDIDLNDALQQMSDAVNNDLVEKWSALGDQVYEPGKWTVRDMIQHIIDGERVFAYRALTFARKDKTILPGFEENDYAIAAEASRRPLEELVEELKAVHQTTQLLFRSFTNEMLTEQGATYSTSINALALGFTIAGHQAHHFKVLEERYYPLLKATA